MTIFATLQPLEKVSVYTPLGIRFWDLAADEAVTDGLEVSIRPPGRSDLRRRAFKTASGIYAFQNLPGLRSLESSDPDLPAGAHPQPASPPFDWRFVVEVKDRLSRFLPVNFLVDLPHRGIYPTKALISPPGASLRGFLLFSAPSRQTRSDLAVIQAQLVERIGPGQVRPAAYAALEIKAPQQYAWKGIADENGAVLVSFPYPPFAAEVAPLSPPPGPPETRIQAWDITIRVYYKSNIVQSRPDSIARLPDLGAILKQPVAQMLRTPAAVGQTQLEDRLVFGQPLLLQTTGTSEFWIEP